MLREAAAVAAVCCAAALWLHRRHRSRREQRFGLPSQLVAVQSSVLGRYDVFISHAGRQKDFALWVRSHVRICGYRAFVDSATCGAALCATHGLAVRVITRRTLLWVVGSATH